LFFVALGFAVLRFILCLPLRDVPPLHSDRVVPPRNVLVTATQRNLLSVWLAAFTFFIGAVALFSFMKTFVAATGTGGVGSFFGASGPPVRGSRGWLPHRTNWL
jgi:hypothetical protein